VANIIIKSDERRAQEESVRRSFCVSGNDAAGKDAAEVIAARTNEALEMGKEIGGRKSWSY